jgi:hypothetical protein
LTALDVVLLGGPGNNVRVGSPKNAALAVGSVVDEDAPVVRRLF